MTRSIIQNWNKSQLRWSLVIFFISLAIPVGLLISQAYSQLKWEAFHRHQIMSNELISRVDTRLQAIISDEESRPFTDYSFLNITGESSSPFLQLSPLSQLPYKSPISGLIGYFQIDHMDKFSTPLLPDRLQQSKQYGVTANELKQRIKLQSRIYSILNKNKLVQGSGIQSLQGTIEKKDYKTTSDLSNKNAASQAPALQSRKLKSPEIEMKTIEASRPQIAFDRLNEKRQSIASKKSITKSLGRLEDLNLKSRYPQKLSSSISKNKPEKSKRDSRKERNISPLQQYLTDDGDTSKTIINRPSVDIRIFNSKIDNIKISILDSGHLVLFRKVWRNNNQYIQGLLIDTKKFLSSNIQTDFNKTSLSNMSNLLVAYQGNILSAYSSSSDYQSLSRNNEFRGDLLQRAKLSQPFNDLELVLNIKHLPVSGESNVITMTAIILFIVFIIGFSLMYWLGISQIAVTHQQQNFVSAVSHELKTPLTSIRMYSELLREGWAKDEKKNQYYEYIHEESERLSRLITNVLQLSRITHNSLHPDLKLFSIGELIDIIQSKINTQVDHAGFKLNLHCDDEIKQLKITVDSDYFSQIFINLIDNALKFSKNNNRKVIDIICARHKKDMIIFSIRDYGPGIAPDQIKKIFKLFYRQENELTRETVGTGIGLALVQQFVLSMNGQIDVINKKPGAEFHVRLPIHQ